MMQNKTDNIRIAITSDSISHRNYLQKIMESHGIQVVINESLTEKFIHKLDETKSDIVLFDVEVIEDKHLEYLDKLLEQSTIPVIINDVSALALNEPKISSKWNKTLLQKITGITGRHFRDENISAIKTVKNKSSIVNNHQGTLAKNIWVLGASLGGPDALKLFLSDIPKDLPVTFIVAQHLGENVVSLLAEQLDRYTEFRVMLAKEGHIIRHHEVLLTPTDKRLVINPIGAVEYKKLTEITRYSPSIDTVIKDVVARYKKNAGAIIFTGMCDDGVAGCEILARNGGQVWVQDPDSCVISTMPDSVAKKITVNFSGAPTMLAKHLVSQYKKH